MKDYGNSGLFDQYGGKQVLIHEKLRDMDRLEEIPPGKEMKAIQDGIENNLIAHHQLKIGMLDDETPLDQILYASIKSAKNELENPKIRSN